MFNKAEAIELWRCIKVHEAVKKIGKVLDRCEADDYILFIRTPNNSFLHGAIAYSDIPTQLAHLLEVAANELDVKPTELIKDIEAKIYQHNMLLAKLDDISERQYSLSHEEVAEEIRQAFKDAEMGDEQIKHVLRKYNIKVK